MNEKEALRVLNKAKIHLMSKRNATFYASICVQLPTIIDNSQPTAYVDGYQIGVNSDFLEKLSDSEVVGLLIHEILHVVYDHLQRSKDHNLNPTLWNMAGDYFINPQIAEIGFQMPVGGLLDTRYKGMTTKQIYDLLLLDPPPTSKLLMVDLQPKEMEGSGSPQEGIGEASGKEEFDEHIKDIVSRAVNMAKMAKDYGSIPGELRRALKDLLDPVLPWNVILMNRLSAYSKNEYSYRKPNRKYWPDLYLPVLFSETLGEITVAIDVSGSITQKDLDAFFAEVKYINDIMKPKSLRLFGFDTKIHDDLEFSEGDTLENVTLHGGGGTNVAPILRYVQENSPELCLIFTDGYFSKYRLPNVPGTDLIWIIIDNPKFHYSEGEIIHFNG